MLDALALFVTIVESGSLSAAAERLDLPAATVTRRLQALERELGCRLLHRSARRLQPTAEGLQYYEQCRPLIHALGQATRSLDDNLRQIAGHIRVLAPVNLASGPLTPAWVGFLQQHPQVSLEFQLSNTLQDLVGSGADLAIRVGEQADSLLTHKRLGQIGVRLVAAPAYLARRGTPASASDLAAHDTVISMPLQEWPLRDPATGVELIVRPTARLRTNEMRLAVAAAEAGQGILLCPATLILDSIARGTLTSLLDDWMPAPRPLFAVWPQQRYLPARVRALVDHLQTFVETAPIFGDGAHPANRA
ncbi:LysR family transcriptional regulator [Castellaniella hirudinis]|uniref:LysR family transcriptional regulator n=1 Tax=Castellaniella hirudinis TaxID=1144617 RepID=A0ABV8S0V8_9BURK